MYYQIHPPFIMLIELSTNTENTANANANTKSRLLFFFLMHEGAHSVQ